MKIDLTALPDIPASLEESILEIIRETQEYYEREISILHEQLRLLRGKLYGRSSEKIPVNCDHVQLVLFDMPEPEDIDPEKQKKINISGHTRRKPGRKPLPIDLPRKVVVVDIDEKDKLCACGCELVRIGEEVSEKLEIIPAQVQVIRYVRPKYGCKNCEGGQDEAQAVKIAPPVPQIIPKSIASASLLAYILISKFVDHLPFYRIEKIFDRIGVELHRSSMCNWAMKASEAAQPLYNLLCDEIRESSYVRIDETTVQVLKEPGRLPTAKSYMWVFQRGDPDRKAVVYQYSSSREGQVAKDFLDGFKGYVQTDGYAGYDFFDHVADVRHVGCWAHARRKFRDAVKSQPKKKNRTSADVGLGYITRLYSLEKKWRKDLADQKITYEERGRLRQQYARPILDDFYKWLCKQSGRILPKSLTGKAVSYTLNQWDRLVGYIEEGHLDIDNNKAENAIRPFVVGRKNWLFAGTPKGAEASAMLYSLVETAKANGLEPYAWLKYIFEKLPLASSLEDYQALLPWNVSKEQIES